MTRNVTQIRPKGDPGAAPYAPQRDISHIFLPMLREVFNSLDEKHWNRYFADWFQREGITEEQLGETVRVVTEAVRLFIRDREVNSPADAFAKAGIDKLPEVVKYSLFCRIGEVVIGGFFVALRDVTMQGVSSPSQDDMAAMIAAGRALSERLSGRLTTYEVEEVPRLKAILEEEGRVKVQLQQQLWASQEEARERWANEYLLQGKLDAIHPAASQYTKLIDDLQHTVGENWLVRMWHVARVFCRFYRGRYVDPV